ncbi:hypothetical protein ACQP3L_36650, partial [Escherichia coli]
VEDWVLDCDGGFRDVFNIPSSFPPFEMVPMIQKDVKMNNLEGITSHEQLFVGLWEELLPQS